MQRGSFYGCARTGLVAGQQTDASWFSCSDASVYAGWRGNSTCLSPPRYTTPGSKPALRCLFLPAPPPAAQPLRLCPARVADGSRTDMLGETAFSAGLLFNRFAPLLLPDGGCRL
jgi:hypothetical protein